MSFETSLQVLSVQQDQETECSTSSGTSFDYLQEFEDMWEDERRKVEEQQNNEIFEHRFENLLLCIDKDPTRSV